MAEPEARITWGVDRPTAPPARPTTPPATPAPPTTPPVVPPLPATPPAAASASAGTAAPGREGDAERTSRFVPLRSPDDPPVPSRKPAGLGLPEVETTVPQPVTPEPVPGEPAPLDLLAQLTNTPPPPETPLRTVVRRVKIWTPLVLLLAVVFCVVQALRPLPTPGLKLDGDTSYTFGGSKLALPWPGQGQSAAEVEGIGGLGTSGAQKPVPIASVTKVMTAYLVLRHHPLSAQASGPKITIDAQAGREAKAKDESRVPVKKGQRYTERQMLDMLLIPSGNNIARLLARWDAGSEAAFVKKMNAAADDLGMRHTTYTDPSGLKASTKSTASDQLKLAAAAMRSAAFRAVVGTPNIQVPGLGERIYNNNNLLVKPGVVGIKTGSSTPAGGALMWGAEQTVDGHQQLVLGVVLGQRSQGTLDDSLQLVQTNSYKLITTVQQALTSATVVKKGEVVGSVDDGLGGSTPLVATKDLKAVGWPGLKVDLALGDGGKDVPHEAKAGTVVGQLSAGSGPGRVQVPVALKGDLHKPGLGAKLGRLG